jgi:hypothetical protein
MCYNKEGRKRGYKMKKIWFDMDGTIADLYGVEGWLDYIINGNEFPYANAKPMVNMSRLARRLNGLKRAGYEIGIISWLAKGSNEEYDKKVAKAKKKWLKKHLASVEFNEIHIVAYGVPKESICEGILFDDEIPNRERWGEGAYEPCDIFKILAELE